MGWMPHPNAGLGEGPEVHELTDVNPTATSPEFTRPWFQPPTNWRNSPSNWLI